MTNRWGYVLPIKERYWNRFCKLNRTGKTVHAYVQAGSVLSSDVKFVFFYSVHPFKEILGFAEVLERIEGNAVDLWNSYGQETCLKSYDEYVELTRDKAVVTLIRFESLYEASDPVSFDRASSLLRTERMSQTGMYLDREQTEELVDLLKQQ